MASNGSHLDSVMQEDAAWLRRLAARLIDDSALADDACQEAWLVAARRGLSDITELRPALFRWMRRSAWRWRRAEERRGVHEQAAAPGQSHLSTDELLSRAEERQRLWRRVTELPEPYRTTLLLRFQEGVSTAAVAERFECTAATVRKRVERGLSQLRERYKRDGDGTGMKSLALVALPVTSELSLVAAKASSLGVTSEPAVAVGAWTMKKTTLALTVVALLAGGVGLSELASSAPDAVPNPSASSAATASLADASLQAAPTPEQVARRSSSAALPAPVEAAAALQCVVVGELVDEEGVPISSGEVALVGGSYHPNATPVWTSSATTTVDGTFAVSPADEQADEDVRLVLRASPFHQVATITFGPGKDYDRPPLGLIPVDVGSIELTAASVLSGRLIDENNHPIERAWIDGWVGRTRFRPDLDGRFSLAHLRPGTGGIRFTAPGYLSKSIDVTLEPGEAAELGDVVLALAPRVQGIVTNDAGALLLDAKVSPQGFGLGWVFETVDGHFDIPLPSNEPANILARASGYEQSRGLRVTPGEHNVHLRLAPREPRGLFTIVDARDGSLITKFGTRIAQSNQLPDYPPRVNRYRREQTYAKCREGDYIELHAPDYKRAIFEITEAAFNESGQTLRMQSAATLRGRLVDEAGEAVAHREVRFHLGELGGVYRADTKKAVPCDRESDVGRIFAAQTITSIRTMVALDEPLPPVVMSDFPPPSKLISATDAEGYFEFTVDGGTGRLFVLGEDGVATNVLAVDDTSGRDLGDVVLEEAAHLSIRLLPTPFIDLEGFRIKLGSLQGRSAEVSGDGAFEFGALPAGDHWFHVRIPETVFAPELKEIAFFLRLRPGENRTVDLPIAIPATCELELTLNVNGAPAASGDVQFLALDGRTAALLSVDETGQSRELVEAGTPLSVTVWIDAFQIHIPGTLVLPNGSSTRSINVETGSLEVALPSWFELPDEGSFELIWDTENGSSDEALYVRVPDGTRVFGSASEGFRVLFPNIPTGVTRFTLRFQEGQSSSRNEWQLLGSFVVEARGGQELRVTLR